MDFGQRLRRARQMRGYSQRYVADRCGVSQSVVAHWENGRCSPQLKHRNSLNSLLPEVFGDDISAITARQVGIALNDAIAERDRYKEMLKKILEILKEGME